LHYLRVVNPGLANALQRYVQASLYGFASPLALGVAAELMTVFC